MITSEYTTYFWLIKHFFLKPHIINLNLSPLVTACSPLLQMQAHTKHILPKTSCSACSNEKGVNCLQVPLCWCVLAGVAFASVEKHREICSAVLPLSTMEESRDGLTAFWSSIWDPQPRPRPQQQPTSLWEGGGGGGSWLFTLQQPQMSRWICQHQMFV